MRAFIVIHSIHASGGAERTAANLANAWQERGWEVNIVTVADATDNPYLLSENVEIIPLGLAGRSRNFAQGLIANLRRITALRRRVRAYAPDFVLGMMPMSNILVALACVGTKSLTIGSERSYPPQAPIGHLWSLVRRLAYGRLDVVTGQTEEAAVWLRTHTWARRVTVIPNAVRWPLPTQAPIIAPASVVPDGASLIVAAGRLAELKGFDRLIEAFSRIAPAHPSWSLAIIGEGPERPRLEQSIERLGLTSRVALPGHAGNLADWYARASLFALTSRYEGFPNVLLEAMSYGLPAVSFDCDVGPRNIVREGKDGFLVPVGDVEGLADKMSLLADDEVLRRRMGRAATDVRTRFAPQRILQEWDCTLQAAGVDTRR